MPAPVKSKSFRVALSEEEYSALHNLVGTLSADSPSHVIRHLIRYAASVGTTKVPPAGIPLTPQEVPWE